MKNELFKFGVNNTKLKNTITFSKSSGITGFLGASFSVVSMMSPSKYGISFGNIESKFMPKSFKILENL